MVDWRQHSRPPGMPPARVQPPRIRPEEIEPVACQACGSVYRLEVFGFKHVRHRITQEVGESRQVWWLCLGIACGRQVDNKGAAVAPDSADAIPPEIMQEVKRGR